MNQTEAYAVFSKLCEQIEKEAEKRQCKKLQLDKTLPPYEVRVAQFFQTVGAATWSLQSHGSLHCSSCMLGHLLLIPLIVFVFVDFRIFNGRFVAWLHWSFSFSVIFAFFTRDLYHDSFDHFCFGDLCILNGRGVDFVAKPPWFHWLFFLRWIWQPWTVPSQNCMWKICQKKKLQVRRRHPNTAG